MSVSTATVVTPSGSAPLDGHAQPASPTESPATRTTIETALRLIREESDCSTPESFVTLAFIIDMVDKAVDGSDRAGDAPGVHHLTDGEMASVGYRIMDDIMPHAKPGTAPAPGSAHEAVVFVASDTFPGVFSVTHSSTSKERRDCTVNIGTIAS